jgi:hypothetical protein
VVSFKSKYLEVGCMFSSNLATELIRRGIPGKVDIGVVSTGFLPMVNEMPGAAAKGEGE